MGSHSFPYQSLLLSTTVLNDIVMVCMYNIVCVLQEFISGTGHSLGLLFISKTGLDLPDF